MLSVVFLAFALSADAFAVAFSYGLVIRRDLFLNALKLGMAAGLGQFVMPIVGWLATGSVHRYVEAFDHWIAFAVFLFLGLNVIAGAWQKKGGEEGRRSPKLSLKILSAVAVATSIDACVAGISLYFMPVNIWLSAFLIGIVCMAVTIAGFGLSCCFQKLPTKLLQTFAGIVLIGLGVNILYNHLCQ